MRLTLRTLLAYLDDVLSPADARELGQKFAESDTAKELASRMKLVVAQRSLGSAAPVVPEKGVLPEDVAGWLDNALTTEKVLAFERAALESDAVLAEAAACHQILVNVLSTPMREDNELRQQAYALDAAKTSAPVAPKAAKPKTRPVTEPAAPRRAAAPAAASPAAASPNTRVFVSHSTRDRDVVEGKIVKLLNRHGIETWYAPDNIASASLWERAILDGLRSCNWFLLVMSPHSAQSEWVRAELNFAMTQRGGAIVPVAIDECDPYAFHLMLPMIQGIDLRKHADWEQRLLQAIVRR